MKIGVIGGSGLYELEGLSDVRTERLETPFGPPSDEMVTGMLGGRQVYFLPRHGRGHRLLPSEINHRANVYAFKALGVECVVSVSAVGSLREEMRPRDVVLPDQYFDRTRHTARHTFFGEGVVAHISFAHPGCTALRACLGDGAEEAIRQGGAGGDRPRVHRSGTYVNMEGPAFSTLAESGFYRSMGFDIIGMTSLAEAKLCREAEICYQSLSMVTDYDCWHAAEGAVTVDKVIEHLQANTQLARGVLARIAPRIPETRECDCGRALAAAILTPRDAVSAEARKRLGPIVSRYL